MDDEKTIEQKELEAIIEEPRQITLASGNKYIVYPLSIGKIKMITDRFGDLLEIIGMLTGGDESKAEHAVKAIKNSADSIVEVFYIITQPNEEKEIIIDDEIVKGLAFGLTTPDLVLVVKVLKGSFNISDLIKKVMSLTPTAEAAEVGPESSGSLSDSQNGNSNM